MLPGRQGWDLGRRRREKKRGKRKTLEVLIAWNGPEIHADEFIKETIDHMHGANEWLFTRGSWPSNLKFFR